MDHPANSLKIGAKDQIATLAKLQPATLLVNQLPKDHALYDVRNSFEYVYVIDWIYKCKHTIKLTSEYFDNELFEMELLDMVVPPPLDESVLFVNKFKLQLVHYLTSSKFTASDFDLIVRNAFGDETPLGTEEEGKSFNSLSLQEKFQVFYTILNYITTNTSFRHLLDKYALPSDELRINVIKSTANKNIRTDYLLMFNDSKLYKQVVEFPQLNVPKKRKESPNDPESYFKTGFNDPIITFETVTWDLYDVDKYIQGIKKNDGLKILKDSNFQYNLVDLEIKKRRIIVNRKKEYQMLNLMATRKKSSRLEARERQKQDEQEELKRQKQEELQKLMERKSLEKPVNLDTNSLSREQRLKMRKLNTDFKSSPSQTPGPEPVTSTTPESKIEQSPSIDSIPVVNDSDIKQETDQEQTSNLPEQAIETDQEPTPTLPAQSIEPEPTSTLPAQSLEHETTTPESQPKEEDKPPLASKCI